MKYLLLADGKSPHTLKWLRELVKYFEVYLITLNGVSEEVLKIMKKGYVFVLNESIKNKGGNYKLLLKLPQIRAIVKSVKPKFINAHYLSSYGFLAALSKVGSVKLIQSVWGTDVLVQPFQNKLRFKIAEFSLRKADIITTDSYYVNDIIKKFGIKEEKILTFPFGLDKISPKGYKTQEKRNIVFSNRKLSENYNIHRVITWFSRQPNSYSLVIANDGHLRSSLQDLVKKLNIDDRVRFVGYLSPEEQKVFYSISKYYISIPDSDSTSVSLLEAMSYGCIPIVSNIPANREWILDGVNGVFFHENLRLDDINVYPDYYKINLRILKQRAVFPICISKFVEVIRRL